MIQYNFSNHVSKHECQLLSPLQLGNDPGAEIFKGNKKTLKNPWNFRYSCTTLLAEQASFCVSQVFQFQSEFRWDERPMDDGKSNG